MLSLYQIPRAYEAWEYAVEERGGEVTPLLEQELVEIEDSLEDRGEVFCRMIKNAQAEEAMCREEARRFADRARIAANRMERLKAILLAGMKATGTPKLAAGKFTVAIREAGTPSIRWLGELGDLPEIFRKQKIELDGAMAQQAYKAGNKMDGFSVEFTEYLAIK